MSKELIDNIIKSLKENDSEKLSTITVDDIADNLQNELIYNNQKKVKKIVFF